MYGNSMQRELPNFRLSAGHRQKGGGSLRRTPECADPPPRTTAAGGGDRREQRLPQLQEPSPSSVSAVSRSFSRPTKAARVLDPRAQGEHRLVEQHVGPVADPLVSWCALSRRISGCLGLISSTAWRGSPDPAKPLHEVDVVLGSLPRCRPGRWSAGCSAARPMPGRPGAPSACRAAPRTRRRPDPWLAFSASSCQRTRGPRRPGRPTAASCLEFAQAADHPVVHAVAQQQHLHSLVPERLQVRAGLAAASERSEQIVDVLLPLLHPRRRNRRARRPESSVAGLRRRNRSSLAISSRL